MKKLLLITCSVILLNACGGSSDNATENTTKTNETTQPSTDENENAQNKPSPTLQKQEDKDPTATKMKEVIHQYCKYFNEGEYEAVSELFTDQVALWITAKNIKNTAVGKEASRFLSSKEDVYYRPDFERMQREGQTAKVPIAMRWEGYFAEVEAEIKFDEDFKINSYKESKILKKKGNIAGTGSFKNLVQKFPPVKEVSQLSGVFGETQNEIKNLNELGYLFSNVSTEMFMSTSGESVFYPKGSYQVDNFKVLVLVEESKELAPAGPPTANYLFVFDENDKLLYQRQIGFNYPGAAMARTYTDTNFSLEENNLTLEITEAYTSYYENLHEGTVTKYVLNAKGRLQKAGERTFSEPFMEMEEEGL